MKRKFGLLAGALLALAACARPAMLPPKAIDLNRDGAAALASGDLEVAEARIALALEYNPRFTEAWVNLGLVEMQRGNFVKARKHFVKARDLNPDLPAPHHALGVLCEKEHDAKSAESHYRAALKVDPGFAPARVNLGRILFERGDFEQAREHFLRLTQVAPEFVEGWAGLGEALLRLERAAEAEHVLAEARPRFGEEPRLEVLEARLLLRREEVAAAEQKLVRATATTDRRVAASAWAWLAIARIAQKDAEGGRRAADHALSVDPDDAVAHYALRVLAGGAP